MNADGSSQVSLLSRAGNNTTPAWSPYGDKIAFSSDAGGTYQIYVMDWGGMVATQLTTSGVNTAPAWSPNGSKIAFVSNRSGHGDIFTMEANGSSQINLTRDSADDDKPSWSVDNVIAYASNKTGTYNVFTIAPDGRDGKQLTSQSADGMARYPDWAPDGNKIAFTAQDPSSGNTHPQIWVMAPDGSSKTQITNDPYDNFLSTWSPEGTHMAFISFRDGSRGIYSINAKGGDQTELTNNQDFYPSWQPVRQAPHPPDPTEPTLRNLPAGSYLKAARFVALASVEVGTGLMEALAAPADGSLDTSFGANGKVITDFGGDDDGASAAAVQSDGKIVTAGYVGDFGHDYDFALARYNSDGSLDISFGTGGKVTTDFGDQELAGAVALQSDGKIVAAGRSGNALRVPGVNSDFALARYNSDGSLDTSFGADGKVMTDFGGNAVATSVAIQPDGKIVAVGGSFNGSSDFNMGRYNTDGTLDRSFGTDGRVTTDFGGDDIATSVAVDSKGRVVVGGNGGSSWASDFALARYNTDGSLDNSFGTSGKTTTNLGPGGFPRDSIAQDIVIQRDGKIIAAGYFGGEDAYDFALVRYTDDGSLDATFGTDGKATTDFGKSDVALSAVIQSDGKIVVAGYSCVYFSFHSDFALARYNTNGSLDTSFGTEGKVTTDLGGDDAAYFVAIQPDGTIVLPGYSGIGNEYDFALARYLGLADSTTAHQMERRRALGVVFLRLRSGDRWLRRGRRRSFLLEPRKLLGDAGDAGVVQDLDVYVIASLKGVVGDCLKVCGTLQDEVPVCSRHS